jgi:hypothetical protein
MAVHKIDGVDGTNHFPKKFVTLHGTAAITKGAWVAFDLSDTTNGLGGSVVTAPSSTAAGDPLVFGVATETTSAAGEITIQTAGRYGDDTAGGGAMTDGSITAGLPLCAGNDGSAGQIDQYESGTHTNAGMCGIALSADAAGDYGANEATVMIIDQGYF